MILQIGAFLQGIGEFGRDLFGATRPAITGVLGGAEPGFFSGLGGFLKETGGQLTSAILRPAIQVGEGLLRRELARPILRKQKSELRAQARIQSNLLGQGPAVLGQTAVATGGRVFQPPLLVTNVVPPSPAPPQLRPVGLKAGPADRIASLALKNLAGKGVATAAARRAAGFAFGPLGGAAAAASTLIPGNGARPFETVFPRGPSRLFLPGTRGVPTMPNGIMTRGRSIFQRNAEGGCSTTFSTTIACSRLKWLRTQKESRGSVLI